MTRYNVVCRDDTLMNTITNEIIIGFFCTNLYM